MQLQNRINSFRYAFAGLAHLLRSQPNARIHAAATLAVVITAITLRVSPDQWLWLVASIGSVWTAEAMNTALECLADATIPHPHPLIGRAKDTAAGAVLVTALTAAIIAVIIFLPRINAIIGQMKIEH